MPNRTSVAWSLLRTAVAAIVLLPGACGGGDPADEAERLAPACKHDGESLPHLGELADLARTLRDPRGAGPRIASALASGLDKVLAELGPHLPAPLRDRPPTDGIVQAVSSPGATSVTIFAATLGCLQVAETALGYLHHDSGWALAGSGCLQRTFGLDLRGVTMNFDQSRHGQPAYQASRYQWTSKGCKGGGTDLLLPVVDAAGAVKAYVLHSTYTEDLYDPAAEQRRTIREWRDKASACMAARPH